MNYNMFTNCTIKYQKDTSTNQNVRILVIYPEDENGTKKVLSVPINEKSTNYQNILAWVAEGNTIQEAD
jgi:hypothetical protein